MPLHALRYFNSLWVFITITIILLVLISIFSYSFFMDNSKKIDNIALQNIRENTELQTEELAISLSNKIETITSTMAIIF